MSSSSATATTPSVSKARFILCFVPTTFLIILTMYFMFGRDQSGPILAATIGYIAVGANLFWTSLYAHPVTPAPPATVVNTVDAPDLKELLDCFKNLTATGYDQPLNVIAGLNDAEAKALLDDLVTQLTAHSTISDTDKLNEILNTRTPNP